MLVLDAILTGAKGINLWSSFRTPPPQRSARLYRALVERRLASSVGAGLLPTEHPFLYLISATAMEGVSLQDVESGRDRRRWTTSCANGITERELVKAKNQLRARLVFENDSVTNLGHQLGYFQTVASLDVYQDAPSRIAAVTQDRGRTRREEISANATGGRSAGSIRPDGAAGMTTAVQKGLAAPATRARQRRGRHLEGGAHRSRRHHPGWRAGRAASTIRTRCVGLSHLASRVLDRGTAREDERRDCRSARRARRVAERRREPPRDERQLHVPLGRLRGDARAGRRDRDAAGVSRAGDRKAQRRSAERHPAGRRQPGGHGHAGAVRDAVSGPASVRPAVEGHRRQRQPDRAQGSRRSFTMRALRPSTTTAIIVGDVDRESAVAAGERVFGAWRRRRGRRDRAAASAARIGRGRSASSR